jgi:hypothetical protein
MFMVSKFPKLGDWGKEIQYTHENLRVCRVMCIRDICPGILFVLYSTVTCGWLLELGTVIAEKNITL